MSTTDTNRHGETGRVASDRNTLAGDMNASADDKNAPTSDMNDTANSTNHTDSDPDPAAPHPGRSDPTRTERAAPGGTDAIDRTRLDALLGEGAKAWIIDIVEQTTSTNADLLQVMRAERARQSGHGSGSLERLGQETRAAQTHVKVAYEQTAGRGRRGRSWVARPGDALLFSIGVQVPRGVDGLVGLSLAMGLAVYEALGELPVDRSKLALKWPNDVLVDGAKVSGILIETAGGDAHTTAVVVGIGINLRGAATIASHLKAASATAAAVGAGSAAQAGQVVQPGASTEITGHAGADLNTTPPVALAPPTPPTALDAIWAEPSMTDLLAALLNKLASTFEHFGTGGFAFFREAWCAADAYRGQPVALYEGGTAAVHGIGRGVDAQGQLLLETVEGLGTGLRTTLRTIASGDVSLRPA
jgi:BirA family biotin operon repressor/biotin-[acetyl-CoA-carboxylase] ligase